MHTSDNEEPVSCPACKGRGGEDRFSHRHGHYTTVCGICLNEGTVTAEEARRYEAQQED